MNDTDIFCLVCLLVTLRLYLWKEVLHILENVSFWLSFFYFLFEGARIAKRGLYQWINEKLKIPQCEPTIKSSFVKVSYVLEFKVFVGFGKNLKIRLPLVIGTVPHRLSMEHQQHQDQRQNHQSRQANMTRECKSHI